MDGRADANTLIAVDNWTALGTVLPLAEVPFPDGEFDAFDIRFRTLRRPAQRTFGPVGLFFFDYAACYHQGGVLARRFV